MANLSRAHRLHWANSRIASYRCDRGDRGNRDSIFLFFQKLQKVGEMFPHLLLLRRGVAHKQPRNRSHNPIQGSLAAPSLLPISTSPFSPRIHEEGISIKKIKRVLITAISIIDLIIVLLLKIFLEWVKCKSVSEFLSKAGRVLYTHFENGVTFAEYEDKESVLKAVATLDRTLYNPHVQMYVRVIEDMPGEYAFGVPTVFDTGGGDGEGDRDGDGDEGNRGDGSSVCGDGVDNSCATILGDGENGQQSSLQMHNTNSEERDSSSPPQNGTNDSNKSPKLQSMDDVSEEIDNSPADVSENKNTPCFKEKEELLT
ncbi:alternative splicing factor ASF-1, putative (ASF1) [Plasmodium ovale wallikeri]|uniref:Alternative splicing factor ASF-1, putative (ASF1) n=1 Tax=Plasmodium ovale wallikeri TaxID=864142 RepID=A0A1A9ANK2_PLAOA|nr:alternative splicing factor ASF-1, putative (ASF1) [Plasmodium ovale wallikeri]SBT57770.1 alternative splicing factor ASF-1, putative (ASF1) [Plasmodium ovale wallikeri]